MEAFEHEKIPEGFLKLLYVNYSSGSPVPETEINLIST